MKPPQDDLYQVLDESLPKLEEGNVLVVSSKVVAIHQGRCVAIDDVDDKEDLVRKEADHYWKVENDFKDRLTVKYHTFVSAAGIDESNGDGYYVLLPKDPFGMAKEIRSYLKDRHKLNNFGVIITDSYSLPFRYGAMSISIGFWGLEPLRHYEGKRDLFGRQFKYERNNMIDALAAASTTEMGEGKECSPLVIISDVSGLRFSDKSMKEDFLIPPQEDIYYPLLKPLYKKE